MDNPNKGPSETAIGFGAAASMIVCCFVMPALLGAGALGAVGAFVGNPLVLLAAGALGAPLVVNAVRRRSVGTRGRAPGGASPARPGTRRPG